ncbi:MAG: hypothetical protein AAF628_27110 [Planctomycetota bacterium]
MPNPRARSPACCLAILLGSAGSAQIQWAEIPRLDFLYSTMAYHGDLGRRVVLRFTSSPDEVETWQGDGPAWVRTGLTPGRWLFHALSYDAARREMVAFGDETRLWDGVAWTVAAPPTRPPARSVAAMAFDSSRGRTVLFGGLGLDDTWEWDGARWTPTAPVDRPARRPPRPSGSRGDRV